MRLVVCIIGGAVLCGLFELAIEFIDPLAALMQQVLQPFGVDRLQSQGAVYSEQLQLQKCPLYPRKRTSLSIIATFAFCQ